MHGRTQYGPFKNTTHKKIAKNACEILLELPRDVRFCWRGLGKVLAEGALFCKKNFRLRR